MRACRGMGIVKMAKGGKFKKRPAYKGKIEKESKPPKKPMRSRLGEPFKNLKPSVFSEKFS